MVSRQNVIILNAQHVFTGAYRLFAAASHMVAVKVVGCTSARSTYMATISCARNVI